MAFFAFGLFSNNEVIPGWLGTGSRYASAAGGCPVCINLRVAHRTCALLSTVRRYTREVVMIMRDATRRECESQPPPHSRYLFPAIRPDLSLSPSKRLRPDPELACFNLQLDMDTS